MKLKCLKVMKHVCEQGRPEFRRAMQRRADLVKACLQSSAGGIVAFWAPAGRRRLGFPFNA